MSDFDRVQDSLAFFVRYQQDSRTEAELRWLLDGMVRILAGDLYPNVVELCQSRGSPPVCGPADDCCYVPLEGP